MHGGDSGPEQWRWQPSGRDGHGDRDGDGDGNGNGNGNEGGLGDGWRPDPAGGLRGSAWGQDGDGDRDEDRDEDLANLFAGPPAGTAEAVPAPRTGRVLLPAIAAMAALAIVVVSVAAALLVRLPPAVPNPPVAQAADPAAGTEQPARPAPALDEVSGLTAAPPDGGPALQAVRVAATDTPRHVLHAAIVASTSVGVLTVVTVDAVVLDGQAGSGMPGSGMPGSGMPGSWGPPRHARFGVAQRTDDGTVLGGPWALPPPEPAPEPAWEALRDPERAAAVREVLAAAGFRELPEPDPDGGDDPALALARSSELPGVLRVEVRARAPGAPAVERQQVWLDDAARPALLGGR